MLPLLFIACRDIPVDEDRDGYPTERDCNDKDPGLNPNRDESCDGIDNNCNGTIDEDPVDGTSYYSDADGDGYGDSETGVSACEQPTDDYVDNGDDCDDADTRYHPGADESDCTDPEDYNCDGSSGYDNADGDDYPACEECDDSDASVYPGATEYCNDTDDDCDGESDEDAIDASTWYADDDDDGYGDATITTTACEQPEGTSENPDDCDDSDGAISPAATEQCDTRDVDEDCDGLVNDADTDPSGTSTWYLDADGDGYGDPETGVSACEQPADDYVDNGDDCDDADTRYHPGADESDCTDPEDYNCDGSTGASDGDGDGYYACEECDDGDADINPAATEVCDSSDNDCDGEIDEDDAADATTWYTDDDGDGYGTLDTTTACEEPAGYCDNGDDCDDGDASINPDATEVCGNGDEDCDDNVDDDDASVTGTTDWYPDDDGDGYGDASATAAEIETACEQPSDYVDDSADCDDSDAAINPDETEICDTADADEDCDGVSDDDDASVTGTTDWYPDDDRDGYGDANATATEIETACEQPSGYVDDPADCDDSNAGVSPAATEICDTADADEDCDGVSDDDDASVTGTTTWYADDDSDGYGNASLATDACEALSGYVADADDCDDDDDTTFPGATEVCNDGIINDCDSTTDTCTRSGDIVIDDASEVAAVANGSAAYDALGLAMGAVGDVNGDGLYDLLVSAPSPYSATTSPGLVYVFHGPLSSTADPDTDADVVISGIAAYDQAGISLAGGSGCDLDNNGQPDIAIGAVGADGSEADAGAAYAVLGPVADMDLSTADITLPGESQDDQMGRSVVCLPDADGDGASELVAGASHNDDHVSNGGTVYLFDEPSLGTLSVNAATAEIYCEESGSVCGYSAAYAGDLDGSGYSDLIVGGYHYGSGSDLRGAAFVFNDGVSGTVAAESSADAALTGEAAEDFAGWAVSGLGDVDGDGYGDLAVGAPYHDPSSGSDAGRAYVVFGPASSMALGSADATFDGEAAGDSAGFGLCWPGDVDGDSANDIVIGATFADATGIAYLMYGPLTAGAYSLGSADVRFLGVSNYDEAGTACAGVGDTDGDGVEDLAISGPFNDDNGTNAGMFSIFEGSGL